jgi:hypothetical protein
MKSILATTFALLPLTTAIALPAPQDAPIIRVLPSNWGFTISSLKGPGCPDFEKINTGYSVTRLTYGENTLDGSEIYYWFAAYPAMRASVGDDSDGYTWCETELDYQEYSDWKKETEGEAYRFRLHKNGTKVIATYDLEEGTEAEWKITYDVGKGKEVWSYIQATLGNIETNSVSRLRTRSRLLGHTRLVSTSRRDFLPWTKRLRCTKCPNAALERSSLRSS